MNQIPEDDLRKFEAKYKELKSKRKTGEYKKVFWKKLAEELGKSIRTLQRWIKKIR